MDIFKDFVSHEPRKFSFKIGSRVASGLSGFVAGAIVASIIWGLAMYFIQTH